MIGQPDLLTQGRKVDTYISVYNSQFSTESVTFI